MSYETTQARIAATAADEAWNKHHRQCLACTKAQRGWAYVNACDHGQDLLAERAKLRRKLDENKALDRAPTRGQQPLFPLLTQTENGI